ncbi:MAG: hypothetical protein AAGF67_14325 [Verrucomicrobiota bacterium]
MKCGRLLPLVSSILLLSHPAVAQETQVHPISTESVKGTGIDLSEGFVFEEIGFDASAEIADAREKSGAVFLSFRPGNVWVGARPEFVVSEMEIGREGRVFATDVYESGDLLFVHYGVDHYQTKTVSVIDSARREIALFTAFSYENVSRLYYDRMEGTLYFTILEGNLDGREKALLIAYSLKHEAVLWKSEVGSAHGNFLVYDKHILTHYGFTGEDDFLYVIDRGSGRTLKKHKIATAASHLLKGKGNEVIVPCYTGVLTFSFEEK